MTKTIKIGKTLISNLDGLSLSLVGEDGEGRKAVERFAHRVYAKQYGADIKVFSRDLLTLNSTEDGFLSCIGINTTESGSLFFEKYLDRPAEDEISIKTGLKAVRDEIVEIGTLAVHPRGLCQLMMAGLAGLVTAREKRFMVFTAVKSLQNTLRRLGIDYTVLADADPSRLSGDAGEWGRYYEASPKIIVLDLHKSRLRLGELLNNRDGLATEQWARLIYRLFVEGFNMESKKILKEKVA